MIIEKLRSADFPNLYRSASLASATSQNHFLITLGLSLIMLVLSALIAAVSNPNSTSASIQALVLLVSLVLNFYLAAYQPQKKWYAARALTESVKTVTWRYITRAEPYQDNDTAAKQHFLVTLSKLLTDNTSLKDSVIVTAGDEITSKMLDVRQSNLSQRKETYLTYRIEDQLNWYRGKANANGRSSYIWYISVIVLHVAAIVSAIVRISFPSFGFWPTVIIVAAATGAMAWLQTKRFQELAASYGQTSHEISLLREQLEHAISEKQFSDFVGDAENAFSREHTQWRARRDVD